MTPQNASLFQRLKPGVNKQSLLFIAAFVWTVAGGILIFRSCLFLFQDPHLLSLELPIAIAGGIAFYLLLFSRISSKHIKRISTGKIEKPCAFSFFNVRSYILMSIMITTGITLRRLNLVNLHVLSTFMVAMGIPLLISAFRFFISGRKYHQEL
jgi:hypothetical protein